jgi:hypothetical protein
VEAGSIREALPVIEHEIDQRRRIDVVSDERELRCTEGDLTFLQRRLVADLFQELPQRLDRALALQDLDDAAGALLSSSHRTSRRDTRRFRR